MPNPHEPPPEPERKPEDPRPRREPPPPTGPTEEKLPPARPAPDEPLQTERSLPTPTRTIRDGEIQGHEREMPGDRDSQ
jgi:hypothetical protein